MPKAPSGLVRDLKALRTVRLLQDPKPTPIRPSVRAAMRRFIEDEAQRLEERARLLRELLDSL